MLYVPSQLILGDVKRPVEHAKDVDARVVPDEIGDSVVLVKQYPDVTRRCWIPLPDLRKSSEVLRSVIDSLSSPSSRVGIIGGDVLADVLQPGAEPRPSTLFLP